ncbi:MAG: hypothetical protein IJ158_14190 [Treponema sp.]|nr:hypothetical protein [Treponema sp.]
MKKISKLLALAAAVSALFFASCSDLSDSSDAIVSDSIDKSASSDKEYGIQLYAEDGDALDLTKWGVTDSTTSSSRTIVAEGLGTNLTVTSQVTFWLYGTNQLNGSDTSISNPKSVTFTLDSNSTTTGKVTLGLSASRWNLTLVACDASQVAATATPTIAEVKAAAYYIGYANVDLRSATTLKFYLTADGLAGTGGAKLTFYFDGMTGETGKGTWTKDHADTVLADSYTITADITSRLQNITSNPQTVDPAKFLPASPAENQLYSVAEGSTVNWASIAPGTYNLEVKFTCPASASGGDLAKSYVWSDIIIILPNQTIEKNILVPDVILYKPLKPTDFAVGYVTPTSTVTNTYNAVLAWTDKSNNETYFEVQYTNLAGTSVALSDEVDDDDKWTTQTAGLDASNTVTLGEDFYGNTSLGWVAGSLVKNNKAAVVKLSLGTRYLFRIAAVNAAGHSEWSYATYDLAGDQSNLSTGTSTASYTPVAYSIYKIDDTSKDYAVDGAEVALCANLYRLTYHLNGGSYTFKSGGTATTADLVYYLSQKPEPSSTTAITVTGGVITDGIPILTPSGNPNLETPTFSQLLSGTNMWTSWRRNAVEGTIYQNTSTDYPSYSASDPALATVDAHEVYLPDGYLGFKNLDLFASYTVSSAKVEIYNDITYDFKDGELAITGATGSGKSYTFTYTNSTSATSLTLAYTQAAVDTDDKTAHQKAFKYDNISYSVTNNATSKVVAVGTLDPTTYNDTFDISSFGDGKFNIKVVGEYKGKQYSYVIVLEIVDTSTN